MTENSSNHYTVSRTYATYDTISQFEPLHTEIGKFSSKIVKTITKKQLQVNLVLQIWFSPEKRETRKCRSPERQKNKVYKEG